MAGPGPPPDVLTSEATGIRLKRIDKGQCPRGASPADKDADDDEKPWHWVRITRPFYLAIHEVTQGQYRKVMGDNPSYYAQMEILTKKIY